MFGIVFIYFIWKYFADLAKKNKKGHFWYAVGGIVVYYLGTMLGGLILGIFFLLIDYNYDWDNNTMGNTLIAIPFGYLACYLYSYILKKKWEVEIKIEDSIDDIGSEKTD
jgi:MFS family permease